MNTLQIDARVAEMLDAIKDPFMKNMAVQAVRMQIHVDTDIAIRKAGDCPEGGLCEAEVASEILDQLD